MAKSYKDTTDIYLTVKKEVENDKALLKYGDKVDTTDYSYSRQTILSVYSEKLCKALNCNVLNMPLFGPPKFNVECKYHGHYNKLNRSKKFLCIQRFEIWTAGASMYLKSEDKVQQIYLSKIKDLHEHNLLGFLALPKEVWESYYVLLDENYKENELHEVD